MPKYQEDDAGVGYANSLIARGMFDTETKWSEAAAVGEENEVIDADGYGNWSEWHPAVEVQATDGTKGRLRFPYGDFNEVNRTAVIHTQQRGSQNDHRQIADAAEQILDAIDPGLVPAPTDERRRPGR